ncbi:MAG: hypothetical protein HY074_04960 [Deltaproteobacteria bacterium]|nr:hypothetical protein [Deltaproteobacteria bacterium]
MSYLKRSMVMLLMVALPFQANAATVCEDALALKKNIETVLALLPTHFEPEAVPTPAQIQAYYCPWIKEHEIPYLNRQASLLKRVSDRHWGGIGDFFFKNEGGQFLFAASLGTVLIPLIFTDLVPRHSINIHVDALNMSILLHDGSDGLSLFCAHGSGDHLEFDTGFPVNDSKARENLGNIRDGYGDSLLKDFGCIKGPR